MRQPLRLGVLLGAVVASGCFVQIDHTANPEKAFSAAREEAQRAQERPGPAHDVKILVYDPHDEKLVRVSVPVWLARKMSKEDNDGDPIPESLQGRVHLEDLVKAGRGAIVEVEDDGGERVLVWLR
jgi:hypothetical protein